MSTKQYTITVTGNFTYINFPNTKDNTSVFRNNSISITRVNDTDLSIISGSNILVLTYTNDLNNASASVDSYISNILNLIKSQEIISNNGVDISSNTISLVTSRNQAGRNGSVNSGTTQDVWSSGGDYTGFATSPETVQVFSSSTADTAAGTGARTVRITGLKSSSSTSYETEDVTLNGTTIVTTVNSWYRINLAYVITAGTSGSNTGIITFRQSTTTTNVFCTIPATYNQSTAAVYTVPAGKTGYLDKYSFGIVRAAGTAGSASISLQFKDNVNSSVFRTINIRDIQTGGPITENFKYPIRLPAGTDLKFRISNVSDNGTAAVVTFSVFLLNN